MLDDEPKAVNPVAGPKIIEPKAGIVSMSTGQFSASKSPEIRSSIDFNNLPRATVLDNASAVSESLKATKSAEVKPFEISYKKAGIYAGASVLLVMFLAAGSIVWNSRGADSNSTKQATDSITAQQTQGNSLQASLDSATIKLNRDTVSNKKFTAKGQVAIQNEADSNAAFLIQDAKSNNLFVVDTVNKRVGVGEQPNGTAALQVAGDISTNGHIIAGNGDISLSSEGLRIGSTLVCSARGCISSSSPSPTPASPTIDVANVAFINSGQIYTGENKFTNIGNTFSGNGSGLSNVDAASLGGNTAGFYTNAANISSGTLSDTRLSGNVALRNSDQTFTGTNVFTSSVNSLAAFQLQDSTGASNLLIGDTLNNRIAIAKSTASYTLDVGGSINGITVYQNGNQVCDASGNCTTSSTSLSDSANIARLNANQTFTGNNTFTGIVLSKNSSDSNAALQIQNSTGATQFNVNTADGYVVNNGTATLGNNLQNPGFEASGGTGVSGWNFADGAAIANDSANAHSGNNEVVIPAGLSSTTPVVTTQLYSVTPGDQLNAQVWVKNAAGTNGSSSVAICYYDRNKTPTFCSLQNFSAPGTSYVLKQNLSTVPAGQTYASMGVGYTTTSTIGTWYFDDAFFADNINRSYAIFQNSINSTNAFQVQNSSGVSLVNVDTANGKVTLNSQSSNNANAFSVIDSFSRNILNVDTVNNSGQVSIRLGANPGAALAVGSDTVGLDLFKVVDQTASSSTVFDIADEGAAIFKNRTDSTTAFQIQNAVGTSNILVADTTHTRLAVGQASANYTLDVAGDINSTTGIRVGGSLLCDTSGCLAAAGSGSYIQNNTAAQSGNFYVKSANAANPAGVVEGASGQSSDIFEVKANSVSNPLLSVGNTGATTLRNSSNSTSAFVVQNASASPVFNIDTTNSRIGINTSTPTESLTIAYGNEAFINDPDPATAPVATVNPAAGNLNGTYIYVVTFITPSGETAPSPGSNAPAPVNQQVDLSSIPTGGPRVLARKIYRVKLVGGSPPWNLVAIINDNVTTTYTDNLADGSVGAGATFINSTGGTITLNGVRVLVASQMTSVGYQAGVNNMGNENSFFGYQAGESNTSGGGNTAMGYQALQANTTGTLNLAIGALSLQVNTTGSNNTATGFGALARNTTGGNNVSVGTDSLNANTTGGDNIGIGAFALAGNTTGISNIGIGSSALLQATTGQYNTAVGTGAAQRITTGGKNTGMGYIALNRITTGTGNTALGYDALDSVTTGTNNTALGYLANVSSSNLTNSTAIGANAVVSASNSLVLGGTGANAVKVGIGTATPGSVLDVRGDASFKNLTDSTTAFQVQNASGGSLINVDSSGSKITLNGLLSGELGAWRTASTSIPVARTAHSSVVANGYVYVLGGSNSSAVYYAKLNADGSTGAWVTSTNPLPVGISYQSSVVYSGYVYVIGGVTGGGAQSTVYYAKLNADGSTGAWVTSTNPLPAVRYRQGSIVANGYVYAFGGDNGSTAQSTVYYAKLNADGSTGAWVTSTNPLAQTIQDVSATVANGYVYIVGGYNAGTLSTVYYAKLNADGSTSGWTASANSLPQGMEDVRTVTSNGYIYALAGDPTAGGSSTTSIYYSPLNSATGDVGVWQTNVSVLPSYLQTPATAVTSNGYIYLVGANSINAPVTYYASTSRVQIGANLDLVGLQAGTLADGGNIGQGSSGGSITAGNITAVGSLQVQGSGAFVQGLSSSGNLSVNGSVLFQNSVNSTTALQVQNAAGNLVIQADTTSSRLAVGNIFESPTSTFEVEGPLQDAASGLAFNIKSFDTSSAAQNVGGGIGFGGFADTTRMFGAIQGYHESATASDYSGGLRFFTRQNGNGSLSQIMNLASNGAATFQNSVNSTAAFQIQNATSVSEVAVDTVNDRIALGAGAVPANGILTIGTDTNSSSKGVYFGTDTNLYRRSSGQLNTDGSLSVGTNLGVGNCGVTSAKLCVGPTGLIGAIINENGTSDILNLQNAGTNVVTVDAYGHAIFKNAATYDSATAFQIQNAAGGSILNVDTSAGQVALGKSSSLDGSLVFQNSAGANTVTLQLAANPTGSYILQLPTVNAATGECLQAGTVSGSTTPLLFGSCGTGGGVSSVGAFLASSQTNGASISGAVITFGPADGTNPGMVSTGAQTIAGDKSFTGATTIQNSGTAAFQVQDASANKFLQIDTQNNQITLGGNNSGELGTWTTNANALPQARANHGSITANGYVYVLGGIDTSLNPTSTVYYAKLNADGSTGTWTTNANALPQALEFDSFATAGGYVYVLGGDNLGAQSTVYYAKLNADGSTGTWTTNANALPQALEGQSSVAAGGYIYAIGGGAPTSAQSTVYYAKLNADGSTGTWTTNANALPQNLRDESSFVANGYIYTAGGDDAAGPTITANIYYAKLNADGSTGTWTTNANALPDIRESVGSAVANGYVYVVGGYNNSSQSTVYYAKLNADGSTGTWTTNANALPQTLKGSTSILSDGYIYAIGGYSNSSGTAESAVYYASTQRISFGGSVDLVGLGGSSLADTGSTGGNLTAANGNFIGSLQVQGAANFVQGASIMGNFNISSPSGTVLLSADPVNLVISLGQPSATPVLLVLGNKNTAGDPTCTSGAIYYNSSSSQFRGCTNGTWGQLGAPAVVTQTFTDSGSTSFWPAAGNAAGGGGLWTAQVYNANSATFIGSCEFFVTADTANGNRAISVGTTYTSLSNAFGTSCTVSNNDTTTATLSVSTSGGTGHTIKVYFERALPPDF